MRLGASPPAMTVFGALPFWSATPVTAPSQEHPVGRHLPPSSALFRGDNRSVVADTQSLSGLWKRIITFLRTLFGLNLPPSPSPVPNPLPLPQPLPSPSTRWPPYNPDARSQLFAMFPTGKGKVLGYVSVMVWREHSAIRAEAPGYGAVSLFWQGEALFFQKNNRPAERVDSAISTRYADGLTHFEVTLESGRRVTADLFPDGRTIRYKGRMITLY